MNLKELKKEIPYRWKVQTVSKFKPQATCVAYIDARDCMDLLDAVCGAENWQDSYNEINGKLFCSVGIHTSSRWVHKTDTGTESSYEKDKGVVSDAFKRACVKWGVGRFLYSLEVKYVATNEQSSGNNHPYPVDDNGKRIWDLTAHFNNPAKKTAKKKAPAKKEVTKKEPLMTMDDFNKVLALGKTVAGSISDSDMRKVVEWYNPEKLKSKVPFLLDNLADIIDKYTMEVING